jgi:hypothetical protein
MGCGLTATHFFFLAVNLPRTIASKVFLVQIHGGYCFVLFRAVYEEAFWTAIHGNTLVEFICRLPFLVNGVERYSGISLAL